MCDIALGLKSAGLEAFAKMVNGSYMSQWKDLGLYDDDVQGWKQAFGQAVERTLAARGRIHFNLTDVDVADALRGDPNVWVGRYTAWELQQIVYNDRWFARTLFYDDNVQLNEQQLVERRISRPTAGNS